MTLPKNHNVCHYIFLYAAYIVCWIEGSFNSFVSQPYIKVFFVVACSAFFETPNRPLIFRGAMAHGHTQ